MFGCHVENNTNYCPMEIYTSIRIKIHTYIHTHVHTTEEMKIDNFSLIDQLLHSEQMDNNNNQKKDKKNYHYHYCNYSNKQIWFIVVFVMTEIETR